MDLFDKSRIETPENIDLELPLAGIGSRIGAYLIDFAWQFIVLLVVIIFVMVSVTTMNIKMMEKDASGQAAFSGAFIAVLSLSTFLVNFFYHSFFEIIWRGQTPGKRRYHLRVMKEGGRPIDGTTALIRNFLRIVDLLPVGYATGVLVMLFSAQSRRLGDLAAGTIVVREATAEAPRPVHASTGWLLPEETKLIESLTERELDAALRVRLQAQVAARLAQRLGEPVVGDPGRWLYAQLLKERGEGTPRG